MLRYDTTQNRSARRSSRTELRRRAEAQLHRQPADHDKISPAEPRRLLYELEVHQIELEMQNEELRRAQQELETARVKYVDLFEFAPVGYLTLTETGVILEANLTAANLLGVEKSQLVKKPVTRFIAKEDQDIYYLYCKRLFDTRTRQVCEMRMVRKDGVPFWVNSEAIVAQGSDNALVCRLTLSDLTERKRAEEGLRESERKLRTLFGILPVGVSILDADRKVTFVNPVLETILDMTKDALFGGDFTRRTYLRPDGTPMPAEEFASTRAIKEQRVVYDVETGVVKEDGHVIWTSVSAVPVAFPDWTVVVVTSDITARKQAEEALRQAEENYRSIFENAVEGIYQSSPQGRFTSVNSAMAHILGYDSPDEVVTRIMSIRDQFYADPGCRTTAMQQLEQKGTLENFESECLRKDGSRIWISESALAVRDSNGALLHYEGFIQDITERKRAHEAIVQAQGQLRALSARRLKTIEDERACIAREIHDDFGQSMTALKMDLAWLAKRLPIGDERAERIRTMSTLVDGSIAQMRRIATELRPGVLDDLGLNAALDWQAREFSRRHEIPCNLKLPNDDLALDLGLNTTLFRMFQETLTNVVRHARASRVDVSLQQEGKTLILTVQDNGRGITETETNDPRSLGLLGLRERAAEWGGDVTIRGAAGKGTTVTVRIPLPVSPANGGKR